MEPKKKTLAVFVENKRFERFIFVIIVFNTICLGFGASDFFAERFGPLLDTLNNIVVGIFVVEAILKLIAWRGSYFKDGWNIFDFCIIALSLLPAGGVFSGIRIIRILRILRSLRGLRVISSLKQLRRIVQAIFASLPGIGWTGILMLLIFYMYAIIGIYLFSDTWPAQFGAFPETFVTLFSLATMEGWQDTVFMFTDANPAYWIYFLSFFILSSFILLNLIIGIVVDNIDKAARAVDDEDEKSVSTTELSEEIKSLREQLDHIQSLLEKKNEESA